MRNLASPLFSAAFAGSSLLLVLGVAYCWHNESGHSGLDPLLTTYLFAPACLVGIAGAFLGREAARPATALAVVALFGMSFGAFISKLNILNGYEEWISAGMPERNPGAGLLLIGFLVGALGLALVIARLTPVRAEQDVAANP
jgi:hypothetical protein